MKKITSLVLCAFLFLLLGCRAELDPVQEQSSEQPAFTIIHNNARLLQQNPLLSNKILKARTLSKSSSSGSFLNEYTIHPERVTYVSRQGSDKESYAFYVEKEGAKSNYIIENIVFSKNKNDQDYNVHLITYFLPQGVKTDSKDIRVEKFEKLSSEDFSFPNAQNKTANRGGGCTIEYIIEETQHACYSGEHYGAEEVHKCDGKGSQLPYSTYVVLGLYDGCNGPADGGGPSSPGSSGNPNPGNGSSGPPVDTGISLPPSCQGGNCGETILANEINELLDKRLNYENLLWLHENQQESQEIYQTLQNNMQSFMKNFYVWGIGFLSDGNTYADFVAMKNFTLSFWQNNPSTTWEQFQNWFITKSEGQDGDYIANLDDVLSSIQYQQKQLPSYSSFEINFPKLPYPEYPYYFKPMPASQVYSQIGGNLFNLYTTNNGDNGPYRNACATRLSLTLNRLGILIPNNSQSIQGGNMNGQPRYYIVNANIMADFLKKTFGDPAPSNILGEPDCNNPQKVANFLAGKNGIYVIVNKNPKSKEDGGAGYSGHVDLIKNGYVISGANTSPKGGVKFIKIWTLN